MTYTQDTNTCHQPGKWRSQWKKQVSRVWMANYVPQILWEWITYPWPRFILVNAVPPPPPNPTTLPPPPPPPSHPTPTPQLPWQFCLLFDHWHLFTGEKWISTSFAVQVFCEINLATIGRLQLHVCYMQYLKDLPQFMTHNFTFCNSPNQQAIVGSNDDQVV